MEEERVRRGDETRVRDELLGELVRAEVLLPAVGLKLVRKGELRPEPLDESVEVRLQDPGIVRAAVEVGEVDLPALGKLGRGGERGFPLEHPLGRSLAVGAELAVLLGGRAFHLGDVLEEEAAARATLEADREERLVEAQRDGAGLVKDLDFLGMGLYEVEDLVVGPHGVLEQWREGGDGLPAARRSVHEQRSPALPDLRDLAENRFLTRPWTIGE